VQSSLCRVFSAPGKAPESCSAMTTWSLCVLDAQVLSRRIVTWLNAMWDPMHAREGTMVARVQILMVRKARILVAPWKVSTLTVTTWICVMCLVTCRTLAWIEQWWATPTSLLRIILMPKVQFGIYVLSKTKKTNKLHITIFSHMII
jgi:hypothetical protein